MVRGAILRRRGPAVPRGGLPGMEPGTVAGCGRDRGRHQRRRRLRDRTSRPTAIRRRRSGAAPSGSRSGGSELGADDLGGPVGRRDDARARARRARRQRAPGPSRGRSPHRGDARRAGRRRHGAARVVLVARPGRPASRGDPRASRRGAPGDLGPRLRRVDRPRPRPTGPVVAVAWWPDAASLLDRAQRRGPRPPLPVRSRSGAADPDRPRPRHDRVGAGAPRRRRVVPALARRAPAGDARRGRRRGGAGRGGASARPAGRSESWQFDNGEGDRVHGFYVTPEGDGPVPDDDVRARRADRPGHGRVGSRGARLRRHGVRGGHGELPRVHRVRAASGATG